MEIAKEILTTVLGVIGFLGLVYASGFFFSLGVLKAVQIKGLTVKQYHYKKVNKNKKLAHEHDKAHGEGGVTI